MERNGELHQQVAAWLKKHGKVSELAMPRLPWTVQLSACPTVRHGTRTRCMQLMKPKLSSAQKEELNVVFGLMDGEQNWHSIAASASALLTAAVMCRGWLWGY